jgi:Protein of unknown function (DUF3617)
MLFRTAMLLSLALCGTAAAQTNAKNPDDAPRAGEWRMSGKASGGPMGGQESTATVCIKQQELDAGFEIALLNSAPEPRKSSGGEHKAPKCAYSNIVRTASGRSSGTAACTGPRGEIAGPLSMTYSPEAFDATQTMAIKGPFGEMRMTRTVAARRIGPCR